MPTSWYTGQAIQARVVVYSFHSTLPIDLSDYVQSVLCNRSIANSVNDSLSITLKSPVAALAVEDGDWIEFSIVDQDGSVEHVFFGQITSGGVDSGAMEPTSGSEESSPIEAVGWGAIFYRFMTDLRTYLRVNAESLFAGNSQFASQFVGPAPAPAASGFTFSKLNLSQAQFPAPTLPSLAMIAQGKLFGHPWQAVQLVMHFLFRYGGTFAQRFWLPESFTGFNEPLPLVEFVSTVTQTRLPRNQIQTRNWGGRDPFSQSVVDQLSTFDVADFVNSSLVLELGANTHWNVSDWYNTYRRNTAFVAGLGMFRDFVTYDLSTMLWDLAVDMSDSAFNELFCTLLERADFGTLPTRVDVVDALTGEQKVYQRLFSPTIAMRPIPHPTYRGGSLGRLTVNDVEGEPMTVADRSNYDRLCNKFVVQVGHTTELSLNHSLERMRNYVSVLPQDQEMRGLADFDAAWLQKESGGVLPILDDDSTQHFGFMPLEPQTRYYWSRKITLNPVTGLEARPGDPVLVPNPNGPGLVRFVREPRPIWQIVGSKILALYAWNVRGHELLSGSFTMPMVSANVPRPGDVGYLFESGSERRNSGPRAGQTIRSALLEREFSPNGALSVYAESVSYRIEVDDDHTTYGTVSVQCSNGQWVATEPPAIHAPYARFRDWSEVGIDPIYFLPSRPELPALLDEINLSERVESEIQSPQSLVDGVKKIRPARRKRKGRPARRKRKAKNPQASVKQPPAGVAPVAVPVTVPTPAPVPSTSPKGRNPARKPRRAKPKKKPPTIKPTRVKKFTGRNIKALGKTKAGRAAIKRLLKGGKTGRIKIINAKPPVVPKRPPQVIKKKGP